MCSHISEDEVVLSVEFFGVRQAKSAARVRRCCGPLLEHICILRLAQRMEGHAILTVVECYSDYADYEVPVLKVDYSLTDEVTPVKRPAECKVSLCSPDQYHQDVELVTGRHPALQVPELETSDAQVYNTSRESKEHTL